MLSATWDLVGISKTLGLICLPTVYSLNTAQEHLIKGESNLSSRSGEELSGAPSTRSPVRAVILTGDARVGLVSNVNRQGNILPNEMPPPWMSPVGRVISAVKP